MRAHKLLILAFVAGCAGGQTAGPAGPAPAGEVSHQLRTLSVRQKVGQLVTPWLGGGYMAFDDSLFLVAARWVDSLEVGGIYISVGSPLDIAAKLNALQRRSRLPLLVSSDLEWGPGMRLAGGTTFPHVMAAGATGDPRDAYTIARAAALEGRAVGIHVNFAPDADLNNNPLNPVINTRSFGEDPARVSRLVEAYIRGLKDHGMVSTLKHFPGHGDTEVDSHIGLPVIRAGYGRLDSLELVPFRAGIEAGADVVMSAHIAFPAFIGSDDPGNRPALLYPVNHHWSQLLERAVLHADAELVVVNDALCPAPGLGAVTAVLADDVVSAQVGEADLGVTVGETARTQCRRRRPC